MYGLRYFIIVCFSFIDPLTKFKETKISIKLELQLLSRFTVFIWTISIPLEVIIYINSFYMRIQIINTYSFKW